MSLLTLLLTVLLLVLLIGGLPQCKIHDLGYTPSMVVVIVLIVLLLLRLRL